jgi:hypothetical protein
MPKRPSLGVLAPRPVRRVSGSAMAPSKSKHPLLAVRPREDKTGWYVEAWWTNRPSENIGHFATQSEARNWITLESTSYFVLREIETMIKHPEQLLS